MSKFKYYIVNTDEDMVTGTNDEETAQFCARDDTYYIINVAKDVLLQANGDEDPITEDDRDPIA